MAAPAVAPPSIPHAEVWTPSRSMLTDCLPIPSTDEDSLRRIAMTGKRRRETSAMRELWKSRRNPTEQSEAVLNQYKRILNTRNATDYTQTSRQPPTLYNSEPHPKPVSKERHLTNAQVASRLKKIQSAPVTHKPQMYTNQQVSTEAKGDSRENVCGLKTQKSSKHVTSYSQDYVQKVGMTSLPKLRIRTLSADWWQEIQKRPATRLEYNKPITVEADRKKIQRQIDGKLFMKNSTQTYFQSTVPRHLFSYSIHPEFDSEYYKCW